MTYLTDQRWKELLATRLARPEAIARAYADRRRPTATLGERHTVFLVAADHPARGTLRSGDDPMAMANRRDLLERVLTALAYPDVDGVLASPDVVEDLLLLGALEDKVVIGSMNRGGLDGATWSLDDRFTGYTAATIAGCGLEGGKMLLRIDDHDAGTVATLQACSEAVSQLAARRLVAMVEPLPYARDGQGRLVMRHDNYALARTLAIASALGTTSAYTWLKAPACDDPETVYAATTLPCVVLGGMPGPDLAAQAETWAHALRQPVVRGLVIGRSVLYPHGGDVAAAVDAVAKVMRAATETPDR